MVKIMVFVLMVISAKAETVSIYDSRTDSEKVIVEVCNDKCISKEFLRGDLNGDKVDKWFDSITNLDEPDGMFPTF